MAASTARETQSAKAPEPKAPDAGLAGPEVTAETGLAGARILAASGAGDPLPPSDRRRAEASLGVPLSMVRLHRGAGADRAAARVGARGFGVGPNIVLGAGAGPQTVGHELVHVAQRSRVGMAAAPSAVDMDASPAEAEASRLAPQVFAGRPLPVTRPADARLHREKPKAQAPAEPGLVIVPASGGGALGAYPALKTVLDPDDWNALSAGARRRAQTVDAGGKAPPAEDEKVATEVKVPLKKLFRPASDAVSIATGKDYVKDLYNLGVSQAGSGVMGLRLQREILGRWLDTEMGILAEEVTIGLFDPSAKGKSAGALLTFTLRGVPIPTEDGTLSAGAVDGALNNTFPGIITVVEGELAGLEQAIKAGGSAKTTLAAAKDVAAKSDTDLSVALLDEADKVLRQRIDELGKITDQPYAGFVSGALSDSKTYADGAFAERRKAHNEWRAKHPREKTTYEQSYDRANERIKANVKAAEEGRWWAVRMGNPRMGGVDPDLQIVGLSNMFTGGGSEQVRQLGAAYDKGQISFSQYEETADAVATRGWIFLGVTAILAIATFGLGLYLAPATFAGAVAFGAGTGLVAGTVPMLASNLYTSSRDLSDPAMQEWWKSTSYSAGDIALGGALGAGLGAAFPVAGKLLGSFGKAPSPAALLSKQLPLPEGVVARAAGRGVVELSVPAENVTIRVTEEGWQMIGPAGKNPKAVLGSGAWPEGVGPMADPIDFLHPQYPSRVMMGSRGWAVQAPGSRSPLQFGLWDELALPPAGGSSFKPGGFGGGGGGGGAMVVADQAGGSLVVSGGGSGPIVSPSANVFGANTLSPLYPALPAGPQPYGLLTAPFPSIVQTGPLAPSTWAPSSQFGSFIQQRGTQFLPDLGEGGLWLNTSQGPMPTYYSRSPMGGARVTAYGQADPNFLLDMPGLGRTGIVQPNALSYPGRRIWPMEPGEMSLAGTSYIGGRSHNIPHQETKPAAPGQILSTADPENFFAHPRRYNTWLRRTIEGRLHRDGLTYVSFNQIGRTPRITTGGYVIPEAEYFVQYGTNGQPVRAWRFPFDNLTAYDSLTGNIDDVLASYEIRLDLVPKARIGK